nr:Uncharacterised protein [Ipomoea batatas]
MTLQNDSVITPSNSTPQSTMMRKAKYSGATRGMESCVACLICASLASETSEKLSISMRMVSKLNSEAIGFCIQPFATRIHSADILDPSATSQVTARLNKSQERLIIDSSFVIDRTVLCAAWDEGVTVNDRLFGWQNRFHGIADVSQAAYGFHTCGFQRSKLLVCRSFTTGNDGASVAHTFALRCRYARNVADNRLGHVLFDERSSFFFRTTTDFTDHDDRFSLWIVLEHFQDVDEVRARDRVAADADTGRLTVTDIGGLLNGFIGQGTGTRNDTDTARLVNVARHDADLTFARSDHTRAVWPDHAHACFIQLHLHGQHIQRWDAFGDGDDQLDTCIDSFQDTVFAERSWHIDDGCGRACGFNGFTHGVEHRQAQMGGAAFARCYAANQLRAVCQRLLRVESSLSAGESLANDFGVFTTVRQFLSAQFSVVTFQTYHDRYVNTDFCYCTDDAVCDQVATHDAAEDVNEYRFHRVVRQDDFKGFGYALFGRAAADIQEVRWLATVVLNDVHRTHREACAVNHTTDVAFQRNIVQFPLCRVRFTRIFLAWIAHFTQLWLTEQGIAIGTQFAIQTDQVALLGDHQRVDLNHRQIALQEHGGQTHENFGELADLLTGQAQFKG